MATPDQCRSAVGRLASLIGSSTSGRGLDDTERTVDCAITDLGITYHGVLRSGRLEGVTTDGPDQQVPAEPAQIRLAMMSDDLIALADGKLDFPRAWLSGRIRLKASLTDLWRIRSMM